MAELNERHMGTSGPTDVLAFPLDDDGLERGRWPDNGTSGPDRPPEDIDEVPTLLGDVVVCPSIAAEQAAEHAGQPQHDGSRSEELTSELQSLMRISYAVFCLKKKNKKHTHTKST